MNVRVSEESAAAERLRPQRVEARGRLAVANLRGRTRLRNLFQDGAAKIRMPRSEHDPLEAILINTAGGLTGGDRLGWEVDVGAGGVGGRSRRRPPKRSTAPRPDGPRWRCACRSAAGARLAWLPQETIVFDRAAFARRLDVDLAAGAEALIVEATVFGRAGHGRTRRAAAMFRDRWRVPSAAAWSMPRNLPSARHVQATLAAPAVLGGATAMATVLLVSDDADASGSAAARSSASRAAPAPGASRDLASFLRGFSPTTATR